MRSVVPDTRPTETALVVVVQEAEAAVSAHRRRLDPASGWGVPAHVTVLYPFAPPRALTESTISRLAALAQSVAAFDCTFAGTAWFGSDVLYLVPEPNEPFRALTRLVAKEFPDYPPYEGVHADVVPHLTVGGPGAAASDLQRAETTLLPTLPIRTWVDSVHLMAGSNEPDAWRTVRKLPLATRLG